MWDASGKTAAQITTDVSAAITAVYNRTNQIFLPDTLAIPTKAFAALASKQVANTTMTAAEWVRQNNVYTATTGTPLNIVAVHTLTTGGLVYQRDPDVLRFYLPMPATVRGPQLERAGMSMTYYVMARTGGLEWRIPGAAQTHHGHRDGLATTQSWGASTVTTFSSEHERSAFPGFAEMYPAEEPLDSGFLQSLWHARMGNCMRRSAMPGPMRP